MARLRDIKVVVRSPDGQYLTGGPTEWDFTEDLSEATVFKYLADKVELEIQSIRESHGLELEAIHVGSHDLSESCDRCEATVPPTLAVYTGKEFLCPDCSSSNALVSFRA